MASALLLESDGVTTATYDAVNTELGLAPATGSGDWPPGLVSHVAALTDDATLQIMEVWESQDANAKFFESRLGPALGKVGVPEPSKMAWAEVHAHHMP